MHQHVKSSPSNSRATKANPLRYLILTEPFTTVCDNTTNALRYTPLAHYQLANGLSFSHDRFACIQLRNSNPSVIQVVR